MANENLIDTNQVCELLGVHKSQVTRFRKEHEKYRFPEPTIAGEVGKHHRKTKWRKQAILDWIEADKKIPRSKTGRRLFNEPRPVFDYHLARQFLAGKYHPQHKTRR